MPTDHEYAEIVGTNTFLDSLAASAAAEIVLTGGPLALAEMQADFICSRIDVELTMFDLGAGISQGPMLLILAVGTKNAGGIGSTLGGSNNFDQTPAVADQSQAQKRAENREIILIIPLKIATLDSQNNLFVWEGSYHGPPLGMSLASGKRSWTFIRNVGLKWFIYNSGSAAMSATATGVNMSVRYTGVWQQ